MIGFLHRGVSFLAGKSGRISQLDGLRAFAILLVLMRHGALEVEKLALFNEKDNYFNWILTLCKNGWVGVDLFFVLSGFLVSLHLIDNWHKTPYSKIIFFGQYWLKRILRTFPLYYGILIVIWFSLIPYYEHHSKNMNTDLYSNILFMQDYYGSRFLVVLWSLAVEEKFYFFSPFLIVILLLFKPHYKTQLIILFTLCFIPSALRIFLIFNSGEMSYSSFFWSFRAPFHFSVEGLLFGTLIAFFYKKLTLPHLFLNKVNEIIFCLIMIITFLLCSSEWMSDSSNWLNTSIIITCFSFIFAVLLYFVIHSKLYVKALLSNIYLRLISKLSYSLYICHMLIIPSALVAAEIIFLNFRINEAFIFCVFYIVFSFLLSIILHLTIEKPFLKLKEKI